ncbi:uncharacterized protein LOC116177288 [Photinus pyralis]|uniref:uncharacterized protein LOC116159553 n=1 Tax=Photinus pyralis TaxID=7054 RepID=UPI00126740C4|nr:uncharacterized protein LOC116159553 [Photinus pyralis]XP_031352083.1 uncharacterized protein LOC116177288 [Photinus pyralis]
MCLHLMCLPVCKNRYKSLREKYHREKEKLKQVSKSGAGASYCKPWPLMSFFQFMYDNRQPRDTSSNLVNTQDEYSEDLASSSSSSTIHAPFSPSEESTDSFTPSEPQNQLLKTPRNASRKRTREDESPYISILSEISSNI